MIFLGHLGIGGTLSRRFSGPLKDRVELGLLLGGAILPDVIDKTLLYSAGSTWSLISSGRTFGHSLLFLLILIAAARCCRKRWLFLVWVGTLSHIVLDHATDFCAIVLGASSEELSSFSWNSDRIAGILFPVLGMRFSQGAAADAGAHLLSVLTPFNLVLEGIGLMLLLWLLSAESRRRAKD